MPGSSVLSSRGMTTPKIECSADRSRALLGGPPRDFQLRRRRAVRSCRPFCAVRQHSASLAFMGPIRPKGADLIELLRTNDLVLISRVEAILGEAGVDFFIADQHMSAMEGSLGFLPRRVLVAERGRQRSARGPGGSGPRRGIARWLTRRRTRSMPVTDAFLGGRLRLRQPGRGHRAGTDALLLAAAAPLDFAGSRARCRRRRRRRGSCSRRAPAEGAHRPRRDRSGHGGAGAAQSCA